MYRIGSLVILRQGRFRHRVGSEIASQGVKVPLTPPFGRLLIAAGKGGSSRKPRFKA
jgi:hypothetical protein